MKSGFFVTPILLCFLVACIQSKPIDGRCFSFQNVPFAEGERSRSAYQANGELYLWTSSAEESGDLAATQLNLWRFQNQSNSTGFQLIGQVDVELMPFALEAWPELVLVSGEVAYFTLDTLETGREIWSHSLSDQSDIQQLFDLNPGVLSSNVDSMVEYNGQIFLTANTGNAGQELYTWNGDARVLPTLIAELNAGGGRDPQGLIVFDEFLYFSAVSADLGRELWRYPVDQSSSPVIVSDIYPGVESGLISYPSEIIEHAGRLYFTARDSEHSNRLWELAAQGLPLSVETLTDQSQSFQSNDAELFMSHTEGLYFQSISSELWLLDNSHRLTSLGRTGVTDELVKLGTRVYYPFFGSVLGNSHGVRTLNLDTGTNELVVSYTGASGYYGQQLFTLDQRLAMVEEQRVRLVSDEGCS